MQLPTAIIGRPVAGRSRRSLTAIAPGKQATQLASQQRSVGETRRRWWHIVETAAINNTNSDVGENDGHLRPAVP